MKVRGVWHSDLYAGGCERGKGVDGSVLLFFQSCLCMIGTRDNSCDYIDVALEGRSHRAHILGYYAMRSELVVRVGASYVIKRHLCRFVRATIFKQLM